MEATPVKKIGSYVEHYVSNRRAITEGEKNNALKLAEAASSDAGFKVVMRPSHVYRRFFLVKLDFCYRYFCCSLNFISTSNIIFPKGTFGVLCLLNVLVH